MVTAAVLVASLGYFVDIFDLLLFSIVRRASLSDLGLSLDDQISQGLMLHNLQMTGMLIGGVAWGILGDKRGRLSVLFGSIALYSLGNLANAFVSEVWQYGVCRFVSGLGLAGELGAGITLVAESLPKEKRGYGTMIVATVGVSGAVVAGLMAEIFPWRIQYLVGGVLGLALLVLRVKTTESLLFQALHQTSQASRGNFFSIFKKRERAIRFCCSILIAVPIWYVIGTLIQLAPEFSKYLGVQGTITAGRAVLFSYTGLVLGDFVSGALSQLIQSRLKVVVGFVVGLAVTTLGYFTLGQGASETIFYVICLILGFFAGYWAVFVTIAAEQFGTNLRATVATSAPNFVRASVVPMSLSFQFLRQRIDMGASAMVVGGTVILISLLSVFLLKESFHQDLNFAEID